MRHHRLLCALLASAGLHVVAWRGLGGSGPEWSAGAGTGEVSVALVESVVHEGSGRTRAGVAAASDRTRRASAAGSSAPGGPAGSPSADERARFVAEVGRLIDARKSYPRRALARELEGRVVVAITLDPTGRATASEVEEPAPFALLNEAALAAVRAVDRFPLPPSADSAHLHVPIVFRLTKP